MAGRSRGRTLVATGIMVVFGAALIFLLVAQLSSDPNVKASLGDPTFSLGPAIDRARNVQDTGPLLFQPPQGGGDRDVYVQHLGSDPKTGWLAFKAYAGSRRDCQLRWSQRSHRFTDPCTKKTYGPDPGPAFEHYRTTVEPGGRLVVDFRVRVEVTTSPGG
jgi:hypothetical protein